MALDRHQQLMLDVRQADRAGPVLAPALEAAQGDAEGQQVLEFLPRGLCQGTPPSSKSPEIPMSLPAVDPGTGGDIAFGRRTWNGESSAVILCRPSLPGGRLPRIQLSAGPLWGAVLPPNMGQRSSGALPPRSGHEPLSEQRLAVGGTTSAPARRPEWRTGPEHGLHGGRDELRGLRVDDDVPA